MYPFYIVAALSAALLVYGYGFISTKTGWFPANVLDDSWRAAKAFKQYWGESGTPPTFLANVEQGEVEGPLPIIRRPNPDVPQDEDELFLLQGGLYRLTSHCPEYGCAAWLMDRQGEIHHTWPIKENVPWEEIEDVSGFATFENIYPTGLQLLDSGDLIAAYHGHNTFPFGIGIARLSPEGEVIWKSDRGVHHWIDIGDDGLIYAPAHRLLDSPLRVADTNRTLQCEDGQIYDDLILVYDLDGNIVEEFSLLQSMFNSGYFGLVRGTVDPCDPLHLNHVEVLDADQADGFPEFDEGDLLVSMLSVDSIAVIDRDTKLVKWIDSGQVIAQHNPLFWKDGKILLFDNQGGHHSRGGSRVVTIDTTTNRLETLYPTEDMPLDEEFYTWAAGHFVLSEDGNRILLSLTFDGRVVELDLEQGQILWEYDNVFDMTTHPDTAENDNLNDFARFQTGGAYYVGQPAFLDTSRVAGND